MGAKHEVDMQSLRQANDGKQNYLSRLYVSKVQSTQTALRMQEAIQQIEKGLTGKS